MHGGWCIVIMDSRRALDAHTKRTHKPSLSVHAATIDLAVMAENSKSPGGVQKKAKKSFRFFKKGGTDYGKVKQEAPAKVSGVQQAKGFRLPAKESSDHSSTDRTHLRAATASMFVLNDVRQLRNPESPISTELADSARPFPQNDLYAVSRAHSDEHDIRPVYVVDDDDDRGSEGEGYYSNSSVMTKHHVHRVKIKTENDYMNLRVGMDRLRINPEDRDRDGGRDGNDGEKGVRDLKSDRSQSLPNPPPPPAPPLPGPPLPQSTNEGSSKSATPFPSKLPPKGPKAESDPTGWKRQAGDTYTEQLPRRLNKSEPVRSTDYTGWKRQAGDTYTEQLPRRLNKSEPVRSTDYTAPSASEPEQSVNLKKTGRGPTEKQTKTSSREFSRLFSTEDNLSYNEDYKHGNEDDNDAPIDEDGAKSSATKSQAEADTNFSGLLSAPPEILARGSRARRAYAEAARDGTKKVFRTRLMLVGQERVGKTSVKKALTGQGFDENEAITDGVETTNSCEINIEVAKAHGNSWSLHRKTGLKGDSIEDGYTKALADAITQRLITSTPQDQPSAESQKDLTDGRGLNPEDADAFVADTAISAPSTPSDNTMPNQIASLVEKMIKEQVRLKQQGGVDSADGGGARSEVSLSIWDFAGHDIYYTTHQVFLSWRAVYIIVFDLSQDLDCVVPPDRRDEFYETAKGSSKAELTSLQFINFWLCSIFSHAVAPPNVNNNKARKAHQKSPPIFIVGTHRESVKGDAKEKKKKIDSAFEKIRKTIKKKPFECHVVPKYYAVENSLDGKDEEMIALRRHIETVAMEEPYMGEEIPLRWLLFEEALAEGKINFMSLEQTKELTRPVGMETERELVTMLNFYHDLGYLVYFGDMDDQESLLRDMVILNPQWLIDVFKQVITILDPEKRDGIVSDAWSSLEEDGILEERLIHHMWQSLQEQKEALVELMAKFDLICEAPAEPFQRMLSFDELESLSEDTQQLKKRYYVPSRLTPRCSAEEIGQIKFPVEFFVDFRGFLPDGLFHRMMTRAVRWMNDRGGQPVFLFYRQISLMADEEHQALLEMLPPHEALIKVTVFRAAVADVEDVDEEDNDQQPPDSKVVNQVMVFITETLNSLRKHWAKRIQYDLCFACPKCSKRKLFKECVKKKSIHCGLHRIPTCSVRAKFGLDIGDTEQKGESPSLCRKMKRVVSDANLSDLAEKIGNEWQMLGIRLGLSQPDIDHIIEDKSNAVDRIMAMLLLWRQRASAKRDVEKMVEELCHALCKCNRTDLAEDLRVDAGIR